MKSLNDFTQEQFYHGSPGVVYNLSDGGRAFVGGSSQPTPKLGHAVEVPIFLHTVKFRFTTKKSV